MNRVNAFVCAAAMFFVMGAGARADVTISTHATGHMNCAGGVCTATAPSAFLNVGDLQTMLASSSVIVKATAAAPDIRVLAAVSWSSTNALTLDAYRTVQILKPLSIAAAGGLAIITNDGGSGGVFTVGQSGGVHFWSLASDLTINDHGYVLVNSVPSLASGITSAPAGNFALAADYDAGPDGTYAFAPVNTTFAGKFEGLGNTISNLSIRHGNRQLGLFNTLAAGGSIENIVLLRMNLHATGKTKSIGGGLVSVNNGAIFNAHTSGKISTTGEGGRGGALVGINNGTIVASSSDAAPQIGSACAGGLVGVNTGTISQSFAEGSVPGVQPGGIACDNSGTIVDSYDLAEILGRRTSPYPGGLASVNEAGGTIRTSFAAGQITAVSNFGGIAGTNGGTLTEVYWDINDTGADGAHGCGAGSCTGATGLTRLQLQAALPGGFDPAIWGLDAGINGGFPYLLNNLPR